MSMFMSVKMVEAIPETRDCKEGYKVCYPDGYKSWCPKEEFEKFNFPCSADPDYCEKTYNLHKSYTKSYRDSLWEAFNNG